MELKNNILRGYREKAGLTPTAVAYFAGLSVSAISRYENSNRKPSMENAKKLAELYSVTVEQIYDSFVLTELEAK